MTIKFEKWHGLGNDFIILVNEQATSELALKLCDRCFGIGADGLFSVKDTKNADTAWEFFNSDGTKAQMCGNGIRCFAKYVYNNGIVNKKTFSVETLRGIVVPQILDNGFVKVDMGLPIFEGNKIPTTVQNPLDFEIEGFRASAVSMGNPHCVIFVPDKGAELAREYGPKIEVSQIFPEKTNVEFVQVLSKDKIKMDVWERGCGITLACGTGSCASAVIGVLKGLINNNVEVKLPGGVLNIEYNKGGHVFMSGDATKVFEGEL